MKHKRSEKGQTALEFMVVAMLVFGAIFLILGAALGWFTHAMGAALSLEGAALEAVEPGSGIHKKKTFGPLSSIVASGIITPIIVGKIGKAKTKQGTRECALLAGHLKVAVGKAAPSTVMDTSKNRTASVNSVLRTSSSGQDIAEITICGLLATMDESFPISTRRKPAFSMATR